MIEWKERKESTEVGTYKVVFAEPIMIPHFKPDGVLLGGYVVEGKFFSPRSVDDRRTKIAIPIRKKERRLNNKKEKYLRGKGFGNHFGFGFKGRIVC